MNAIKHVLSRIILAVALTAAPMCPSLAQAQSVNLNMVSVGINRYRQPGMDLSWSVADARQVAGALNNNRLFARKDVNVLTDNQVTLQNLENALSLLERRAASNSYSVLYLSGHGTRDGNGHFIYPTYDYDPRRASQTSLSGEAVYARLKRMPGRVFLIIDACHSGSAGFTNTHFVKPQSSNQTVIISSSLAVEYSQELGQYQNGAFTQAFLESLSGSGDANRDGALTLQEMHNYVYRRVGQLTNNKQHIKTFVPNLALGNMTLAASSAAATSSSAFVWRGSETLQGFGALSFTFEGNNRVVMTDVKARSVGTWSQQGDTVTLQFSSGRVVYQGRMSGSTFSGTASNGATRWNFTVQR